MCLADFYDYSYEELMNIDEDYFLPVEEVSGYNKTKDSSKLEDGDIIVSRMYYDDGTDRYKDRPSVVMIFPDGVLRVVRLSQVKIIGRSKEVIDDPLAHTLLDWETEYEGLHTASIFVPWYYREFNRVQYLKYIGKLTDKDMDICKDKLYKCIEDKDKNLKYLIGWLKGHDIRESFHASGNNNHNPVQSIEDIEKSLSGNCVDFANIAHSAANKAGLMNTIGMTKFIISPNKSTGHIYCVYKENDRFKIFRFIPGEDDHDSFGDIIYVKPFKAKTYIDACSIEELWLRKNHPEIKGLDKYDYITKTRYLSRKDLNVWDKLAAAKKSQIEVIGETFEKK